MGFAVQLIRSRKITRTRTSLSVFVSAASGFGLPSRAPAIKKNLPTSCSFTCLAAAPNRSPPAPVRNDLAHRNRSCYAVLFASAVLMLPSLKAQTIRVDITPAHATNSFVPKESLGAGIDRIPVAAIDHDLTPAALDRVFAAGWQPVTYRQNTDLVVEAWHWNSEGTWSAPSSQGYFTGATDSTHPIRYSYGFALPHRGVTRNDGTGTVGYSRLTDGDESTYWKSNPYLTSRFTGEDDTLHPQWVVLDLNDEELVDTIKIAWAAPYATKYVVQYWNGSVDPDGKSFGDPIHFPTKGTWSAFAHGAVSAGSGVSAPVRLSDFAIHARYIRIWMTQSSNTCDTHQASDPRNCVGYAIREIYMGNTSLDGGFHDLLRHTPDQEQAPTYASSTDPWHDAKSPVNEREAQVGFDLFFQSGVTQKLPAVIPVAMLYDNPDNAAAEIGYLEKHKYPIAYIEMGEEADGQYMLPEDYGALYLQYADAVHRVDPTLKLGGPSFQGVNQDIETGPDSLGRTSWLGRFLDYLKSHGRMQDLQFFSFEHYPFEPCRTSWATLYKEPELVSHIMDVWHNDGVPKNIPMFITETNLSSATSEPYMDTFGGLWLADFVGSFLSAGGNAVYYFHYLPLQMERGCNGSAGTFGMFTVDQDYKIKQPLAQFFASQMINHDWLDMTGGTHYTFPATSDVHDGAGHTLVTAYAVKRPDGAWSVMLINKNQKASETVHLIFENQESKASTFLSGDIQEAIFGSQQYHWHPGHQDFNAHLPLAADPSEEQYMEGNAEPDGPTIRSTLHAGKETTFEIPAASIVVLRGKIAVQ